MEENMKIYTPSKQLLDQKAREVKETKKVIRNFRNQSRMDTLLEVFEEQKKKEKYLNDRFPCFNLFYNWGIGILVIALFVSFAIWGVRISTDRKAAELTATAMAEYQADQDYLAQEQREAEEAEKKSEAYIVDQMSDALAKVFYGAKNFEEKYRYQESDFETLARCVFNRVENKAYSDDIYEVINQYDQWVGYYDNNPILDNYKIMAEKFIRIWRAEKSKPVSNDYLWAEYTPNGIFLKNDFHAGAYAHRYHA